MGSNPELGYAEDDQYASAVDGLAALRRGAILRSEDAGYDEARAVWNGMFHRRPLIIVRPRGAADVMAGGRFVREHGLEFTIRGGGHNVAGNAVCDDGLMLDLSEMRSVRVDAKNRVARVEPGCVLGDMDRETQAHGLVTPGGFISSTGVAGLTLGVVSATPRVSWGSRWTTSFPRTS